VSAHSEERRVFTEFLKKKGLKTTRERTALFDEIFSAHRHFDAEDLVIRMRERGRRSAARPSTGRSRSSTGAASSGASA